MSSQSTQNLSAYTLVEVLCVTVIIGILAGLLLSAVSRAYGRTKRMQLEFDAPVHIDRFHDRLAQFVAAQPSYPPLTAKQLHELGIFDSSLIDFLRWKGVTFLPFASSNLDDTVILEVVYSKKHIQRMRKGDLKPPKE